MLSFSNFVLRFRAWLPMVFLSEIKQNAYLTKAPHTYFWRTTTGQEIDYIEEWNGHLT